MPNIKLYTHKIPKTDCIGTVRLTSEAEAVVRELSTQTGLPIRQIVSEIIIQSRDSVDVIEYKE